MSASGGGNSGAASYPDFDRFITTGRKSALSLYRPDIATMESGESIYNQDDATGFIKLNPESLRGEGDGGKAGAEEVTSVEGGPQPSGAVLFGFNRNRVRRPRSTVGLRLLEMGVLPTLALHRAFALLLSPSANYSERKDTA